MLFVSGGCKKTCCFRSHPIDGPQPFLKGGCVGWVARWIFYQKQGLQGRDVEFFGRKMLEKMLDCFFF